MAELTKKQLAFVLAYVECENGAQAAVKAGYSEKTAANIAAENLNKPYIKKAIDDRLEIKRSVEKTSLENRYSITIDRVAQELAEVVWGKDAQRDKLKLQALQLLGQYLGMFSGNLNVNMRQVTPEDAENMTPVEAHHLLKQHLGDL